MSTRAGGFLKRVSLVITPDLHKDLKLRAYSEETTLQALILKAVQQYMRRTGSESTANN